MTCPYYEYDADKFQAKCKGRKVSHKHHNPNHSDSFSHLLFEEEAKACRDEHYCPDKSFYDKFPDIFDEKKEETKAEPIEITNDQLMDESQSQFKSMYGWQARKKK